MFVARGGFGGGVINQHNNIPMISPQAQSLLSTEVVDMGGTKVNFLIKAHGMIETHCAILFPHVKWPLNTFTRHYFIYCSPFHDSMLLRV